MSRTWLDATHELKIGSLHWASHILTWIVLYHGGAKGAEHSESCEQTVKSLLVLQPVRRQGLSDAQSDQLQSARHLRQSEKADADSSAAIYIQHERSWEGQGERLVGRGRSTCPLMALSGHRCWH